MNAIRMTALVVLVFVACGCRKSQREIAEQKAIERHNREVGSRRIASPAMQAAISNYLRTPEGRLEASEGPFLYDLWMTGKLPGVSRNARGYLRFEKHPTDLTADGGAAEEVHLLTTDKPPLNYYYVIARGSSNAEWRITKAWHADSSGKVLEEYPVQ